MNIDWTRMVSREAAAMAADANDRATLTCSRLQGRLTLGPVACAAMDAIAADPETPWAMRETILNAVEWRFNSQKMDELSWVLGYSDAERLALFRVARKVSV